MTMSHLPSWCLLGAVVDRCKAEQRGSSITTSKHKQATGSTGLLAEKPTAL
eukprot:CAMPEP_0206587894 /NCGR_PEP_ID=MMETSP0325_2-20121206/37935_1 /ASSEMBLY_ACC=CAM_ASM_000347 /TAXON_ID=2866 /ORGANISM="Crypthecodinium cohnii, Strain Seligo" /LENGTH=50 /DNA_ID=CAMNT_0054096021 /DNA_START=191 /DNA_END=340 /DNA_ORIENTATION=+